MINVSLQSCVRHVRCELVNWGKMGEVTGRNRSLKIKKIFTILLVLFSLTGCIKTDNANYYVAKIIDGDTVELSNGTRVRYIGINTPESMKRVGNNWEFDPEPYAVAAKKFNRESVLGKNVILEFDREHNDKYGRSLAYVYAKDGGMVNLELVRNGYATAYSFPPNMKYYDAFIDAQDDARANKRGLWKEIKIIDAQDVVKHIDEIQTIRCLVKEIFPTKSGKIILILGDENQRYLTGIIFRGNIDLFTRENINPVSRYKGKQVLITTKIKSDGSNKPTIIIDNPSIIQVNEK